MGAADILAAIHTKAGSPRPPLSSVIAKSLGMGAIGSAFALVLFLLRHEAGYAPVAVENLKDSRLYSVYCVALGFLVVFRNGQAYNRWWDATQCLAITQSEWMDACCQLIAATTSSKKSKEIIMAYNHVVTRLFSLLACISFKLIANCENEDYPILSLDGLDEETRNILVHLDDDPHSTLPMVEQWLLNTIHRGIAEGIVVAPPPIVSRVFQELGNGTANVHRMAVISVTDMPRPYSTMLTGLLIIHIVYTSVIASSLVESVIYMIMVVFLSVAGFWCINFIAVEIEHPFGDDVNDIDVHKAQEALNHRLMILLDKRSYHQPLCESLSEMRAQIKTPAVVSHIMGKRCSFHDGFESEDPAAFTSRASRQESEQCSMEDVVVEGNVDEFEAASPSPRPVVEPELPGEASDAPDMTDANSIRQPLDKDPWLRELAVEVKGLLEQLVQQGLRLEVQNQLATEAKQLCTLVRDEGRTLSFRLPSSATQLPYIAPDVIPKQPCIPTTCCSTQAAVTGVDRRAGWN